MNCRSSRSRKSNEISLLTRSAVFMLILMEVSVASRSGLREVEFVLQVCAATSKGKGERVQVSGSTVELGEFTSCFSLPVLIL